jgi:hypothetical protein
MRELKESDICDLMTVRIPTETELGLGCYPLVHGLDDRPVEMVRRSPPAGNDHHRLAYVLSSCGGTGARPVMFRGRYLSDLESRHEPGSDDGAF